MARQITSIFVIIFSLTVMSGLSGYISLQQLLLQTRQKVENTFLLWNQPLSEQVLQGKGQEIFIPLATWLKDNEPLVKNFSVRSPNVPAEPIHAYQSFEVPFVFHGAELYIIKIDLNSSRLILRVLTSPLFLGGNFILILAMFSLGILRLRHRHQRMLLRTEMKWQSEKIRWSRQVAHDLRQPLSLLKVLSQSMSDKISIDDHQLLQQTVERIEKTSQDLLQIKKPELPQLGASSLKTVILEIVEEFKRIYPKIEWSLSGGLIVHEGADILGLVPLKKTKLQRVISNILTNAVEASKSGQTIYLGLSSSEEFLVFECLDEGQGFSSEVLDKIGKQEYTTKENGSGLGLYDISVLMNHLGGELQIDSQRGVGSRIQLTFPAIQR